MVRLVHSRQASENGHLQLTVLKLTFPGAGASMAAGLAEELCEELTCSSLDTFPGANCGPREKNQKYQAQFDGYTGEL